MTNVELCDFYGDFSETRAEKSVYEPVGMTKDELLQWYMEQSRTFRSKHVARIAELSTVLLIGAITSAMEDVGMLTEDHPLYHAGGH